MTAQITLTIDHPNQDNDPGTVDNTAIEEVNLLPGYSYVAQSDRKMNAYLDPTIIAPSDYGNLFSSTDFENYEINTNLEVGFTPGAHGVSPSGAATYTVPIQLPPGTNGMEPELAISYNSQAGNGLLGMGWNLAGLSVISRVPKTYYHDGEPNAIKFNYDDQFALDGQRLFLLSGTYGHPNATYDTETKSYSTITSMESSGSGPQWFRVQLKNGITMEYGRSSDSRTIRQNGDEVLHWYLNKIYDVNGNYCEYQYLNHSNQKRINRILYTGNFNIQTNTINVEPYNEIQFTYSDRSDKGQHFVRGTSLKSNYLLAKVQVYSKTAQFREYRFNYGLNHHSFLTEIHEYGRSEGEKINQTKFKYGGDEDIPFISILSGGGSVPHMNCTAQQGDPVRSLYGANDFDGDGEADILVHKVCVDIEGAISNQTVNVWKRNPDADGINYPAYMTYLHYNIPIGYGVHLQHYQNGQPNWRTLDFNGDGHQDLLIISKFDYFFSPYSAVYQIKVILFGNGEPEEVLIGGSGYIIEKDKSIHIGDFNGNGRDDIFISRNSGSFENPIYQSRLYTFDNSNPNVATSNQISNDYGLNYLMLAEYVRPLDFNGDGKLDLLATFNHYAVHNGAQIFSIGGSNGSYQQRKLYESMASTPDGDAFFPSIYHNVFVGDFNGDGLSDILTGVNYNINWHVSYSRGTSFYEKDFLDNVVAETDLNWTQIQNLKPYIGDFNGDGSQDICIADNGVLRTFLSRGTTFVQHTSPHDPNYLHFFGITGDFNGDGITDICRGFEGNGFHIGITNFNKNSNNLLLTKARNAFQEVAFQYESLVHSPNYAKGEDSEFPLNDVSLPIKVLTHDITTAAGETISENSYEYGEARIHRQGKGFLGFKNLKVTDHHFGFITDKWSQLDIDVDEQLADPTYMVKEFEEIQDRGSSMGSAESYVSYNIEKLSNGQIRYEVDEVVKIDNELNIHTKESFEYDEFGNQEYIEKLVLDGETELEFEKLTKSGFESVAGLSTPSLPTSIITETGKAGYSPITESTQIVYTPDGRGLVESITTNEGTIAEKRVEYTYDNNPFGLVSTKTISGVRPNEDGTTTTPIAPIQTDSYVYSGDGRNLMEHTDLFGNTKVFTYYNRWGKIKTSTNHLGHEYYFEYDGFGNLSKEIDHLGNVVETVRKFENTDPQFTTYDSESDVLYSITTTNLNNDRFKKTLFNSRSLERFNSWSGQFYDFQDIVIPGIYSGSGWRNLPFFEGDTNLKSRQTSIDKFGRITELLEWPVMNFASFQPNEFGVHSSYDSNVSGDRSSQSDKTGRVIEREDAGGKLKFVYQSGGLLKEVKLDDVKIVENTYDAFGRQITLWDNNANTSTNKNEYVYDSFDRLIKQTNARLFSITNEYNDLGQIESKAVEENGQSIGAYTYDYYDNGNKKHQLERETAPSGCYSEYEYDDEQNVTKITEFIDGVEYSTSFEYDDQNKLTRKIYPSGFAVRYVYDSAEHLEKVTSDNGQIVIWEAVDGNAQGNLTEYHLNNGEYVVTNSFDDEFYLDATEVNFQGTSLFSYQYNFDPVTSNLLSRNLGNQWEYFEYDEDGLNRLTGAGEEPEVYDQVFSYYPNGNIMTKGNVLQYQYDTERKNAVVQVGFPPIEGNLDHTQQITYNHFNSATLIANLDESAHVELIYGPDDQRRKAEYFSTDAQGNQQWEKSRIYAGGYEKQEKDDGNGGIIELEVHYVSAGGMLVAMYVIEDGETEGEYFYPHTDHLGSIIHITDAYGNIVHTQGFDAWGRTRNPNDLTYDNIPEGPEWLWRGYTGHEHLDEFCLINMNGRLYDPVVGRMLSPDNYVQNPDFSQSYNRYSYVWNNPLKYTDPSGEMVWFIPNLSWSSQGGWDVSGTVAYGVPGTLSAQATVGHNGASSNTYFSAGVSAGGFTGSAGWGTQTGFTAGLNYGLPGLQHGFGTNLTSFGINWSQNGGFSANALGYSYGRGGLHYSPSLSYSHSFYLGKQYSRIPPPPSDDLLADLNENLGLIMGSESQKNVPGGVWDIYGEGFVPYDGDAWAGTNFIGPGENADPYSLPDPKNPGQYLKPIDQIDAAAQRHDAAYYREQTGGVMGALFNTKVRIADAVLALSAHNIIRQYHNGNTNISPRTHNIAIDVRAIFVPLTLSKF